MIIIKTNNGDRFVNEAEVIAVNHDKGRAAVEVWPSRWDNHKEPSRFYVIENVEEVTYTNKEVEYHDEGSEIQKLTYELAKRTRELSDLRDEYRKMDDERYKLKAEVGNLQAKLQELKGTTEEPKPTEAQPSSESKITLHATSPMGSDCTTAYDVDGCEGMTVEEFVNDVIHRASQYVTIWVERDGVTVWRGEYKNAILDMKASRDIPGGIFECQVKSARASGDWGQMSYTVKLYNTEK